MNDLNKNIKSISTRVNNFFKINPHRHWVFLLYVFFILTTILILFSFYLLYQIKNEQVFQVKIETEGKINLLKDGLIKNTIDFYDKKTQKTNEINDNPPPYKDPSL